MLAWRIPIGQRSWQVTVYRVRQSWTRLKQLSMNHINIIRFSSLNVRALSLWSLGMFPILYMHYIYMYIFFFSSSSGQMLRSSVLGFSQCLEERHSIHVDFTGHYLLLPSSPASFFLLFNSFTSFIHAVMQSCSHALTHRVYQTPEVCQEIQRPFIQNSPIQIALGSCFHLCQIVGE